MALLDMQAMTSTREAGDDGRCGGSAVSLLLCDSFASTVLCV